MKKKKQKKQIVIVEQRHNVFGLGAQIRKDRRAYCEKHSVSHQALCEVAGISRSHWNAVEDGNREVISGEILSIISKALGKKYRLSDFKEKQK